MFTGTVEEIGIIEQVERSGSGVRLRIRAPRSAAELKIHDSVSINGACHTVVQCIGHSFDVESVEETLKKTSIGKLTHGDSVNLELPMRLNERLGGHLVLGHVDTTGKIQNIEKREGSWFITITIPPGFERYIVRVGSISIDGVSLTIAELAGNQISVSIIPFTMEHTVFQHYKRDTVVNIEFDLVGKYIERIMSPGTDAGSKPFLNQEQLRERGY